MAAAAAVASPDERRGYVVKAFVVVASTREPSDGLAEEIRMVVCDCHSAYAGPRLVEFVPDLPRRWLGRSPDRALPARAGAVVGLGLSLCEDSVRPLLQPLAVGLSLV